MDWVQHLDADVFRFVNGRLINPVFDQLMPFLSGNAYFFPALILLGVAVIWKFRSRGCLFLLLLALAIALIARDRPFLTLPDARCLLGRGGSGSMPSSHAANWFAGAMVSFVFFRRSLWVTLPLACAVSFSRVYCGVHYPGDILAGAVLGAGTAAGTLWLSNDLWDKIGRTWFPLWWQKMPSLLAPPSEHDEAEEQEVPQFAPRRRPGEKEPPATVPRHMALDDHWLRLGCLLIALTTIGRLAYLASNVTELSPDEALIWLRSKHLAHLDLGVAPLVVLLQWLGTTLWGNTAFGVRFFSPVLSSIMSFSMLRLFGNAVNARAGVFLVLIMTATPLLAAGSILIGGILHDGWVARRSAGLAFALVDLVRASAGVRLALQSRGGVSVVWLVLFPRAMAPGP
jgi:membrane-associated phospholipid phosphatase